ncbi:S8 family serine peptidase [Streptomyces sp. WAC 00631]|uniref:S8 family serine peptidase n=1 Tax=Streptomyces sp. WAC 00631 TaxID=2203201 RepID=UPI0027E1011C|nr:S8 family serine peptidase [Streptomyces sp. WAC 00631]
MTGVGLLGTAIIGTAPSAAAADVQSKQWYLKAMHAEEIWKTATGKGIKVAVIDTGVNPSTASLKGQVEKGRDLTGVAGEATDDYEGHGTTMAELIAGRGRGGLRGLAPDAKIIPFRVVERGFEEDRKANGWSIRDAIRAAADSDADIINLSSGLDVPVLEDEAAVEYALSKGKLFFAAAGNNAKKGNKPNYPASYPAAVSVAAMGPDGEVADYSQHGEFVDLAAPGDSIPSWCDTTFTRYCDGDGGTSAASALASASAALIWSAHPDWTANQVLRVMLESAGRGEGWKKGTVSNYLGHGIVRPGAHINRGIGKPGDPDINPLTNKKTGPGAVEEQKQSPPEDSASPSSKAPEGKPGAEAAVAGSNEKAEGVSLGIILGGVAAAAALAGGALFVLRRRRGA